MEWLLKLEKAINYIEKNLDSEISYEEAAKIACCSTYYFKRMFSYVAGISLSEYIRKRRMTQAAFDLQSSEGKVLDIAMKYGYSSPTAFNRAFQSVHGISPSSAKQGKVLNAYPPLKFSIQVLGGYSMPYRIEEKDAMRVVGIRIPLTEDMEENQRLAPIFWDKMLRSHEFSTICQLSNKEPYGILGITSYENSNEIYYYIAASTDEPVLDGMHELEIPASSWVIFESDGQFKESVQSIFRRFLTEWLPFSGYKYAELPDIEVYPIGDDLSEGGHSEVWVAIKREKES